MKKIFLLYIYFLFLLAACAAPQLENPPEVLPTQEERNQPPEIENIYGEIILAGEDFSPVQLNASDADGDELIWQVSGNKALELIIKENTAAITASDPNWRGWEELSFEVCDTKGACSQTTAEFGVSQEEEVIITHIANSGFLIESGETKLIIDSLFTAPEMGFAVPFTIMDDMKEAKKPFNKLDIILVTHAHSDHFDAELVAGSLANNKKATLITPPESVVELQESEAYDNFQEQIISFDIAEQESLHLAVQGVGIEALNLFHGVNIHNYGYIITIGGMRIFHTGDLNVDINPLEHLVDFYHIPDRNIDVAFVHPWFIYDPDFQEVGLNGYKAKYLIPTHFRYLEALDEETAALFPNLILIEKPFDSWVVGTVQE